MKRSFSVADWQWRDDGRSVEGCIVPYGKVINVTEPDETGTIHSYREKFLPHSLMTQTRYAERKGGAPDVSFLLEHNEHSFDAKIGYVKSLREDDDAAYAVMRLYDGAHLPKVRSMLEESHTGLSVSFRDTAAPKVDNGIICRTQVHIWHVAATPAPAYDEARILAIRNGTLVEESDEYAHFPKLDEVRAWLDEMRKVPT